MDKPRKNPPVWVMAIPTVTFGLNGSFVVLTLPQMLAAQGVSAGKIAMVVAAVFSPGFWAFILAPFLDVGFSRRTYALILGPLAALAGAWTIIDHHSIAEVLAIMIPGYVAIALYAAAVGGWTGSLINKKQDGQLGALTSVANITGGALLMIFADPIIRRVPPIVSALLFILVLLLPMLSFFFIPSPVSESKRASESFAHLWHAIRLMLQRREVLVALVMFALPTAAFSLTNFLGGVGKNFHTSPGLVSLFAGIGSFFAGIIGSLLIPPIAKKFSLRPLYLCIGLVGACFTLGLILLPRAPWSYAIAYSGESVLQAASFATSFAITFEVIGPENPLAATIFALLTSALNLPIIYMEMLDGHGYDLGGVAGAFLTDALISASICILLWVVLFKILRLNRPHKNLEPAELAE